MNSDLKRRPMLAVALVLILALLAGCETFVADGDEKTGINPRGGYFYFLDNASGRLVMVDHNMTELRSWLYADFTSETYVQGLTFDGEALWVSVSGSEDNLYQLDLGQNGAVEVSRTLPAPPDKEGTVRDIAWDGEVFWVLNSGSTTNNNPPEIFQLDPADGTVLSRHQLPSAGPRALCYTGPNFDAYGGGAKVGCYYTDKDDDFIYVFDTELHIFTDGFPAPVGPRGDNYVYPLGIFFDGEGFWTTNGSGVADYLFGLDYEGVETTQVNLPYEQPGAIVWHDRDLGIPRAPAIQQASPNTGGLTAHKTVTVRGFGFRDGLTSTFGAGITVDSITFVNSSEFIANITIGADADLGPRDITVTNPDGQVGVGVGLFSVVETDPSTGYLWFLDNGNNILHRYSINDGEAVMNYDPGSLAPGGSHQGLAYDGTNIWLAAAGTDDIVASFDTTGAELTTVLSLIAPLDATGVVRDMAFDGTDLWVPNSSNAEIYRINMVTGAVLETISTPGAEARGATWANGQLYCNDKDLDAVYVWDPGTSTWSHAFDAPVPPGGTTANRYPTGLTWDGFSFWMCNSTGDYDYIFQISPDGTVLSTVEVPDRGNAQPTGLVFLQN